MTRVYCVPCTGKQVLTPRKVITKKLGQVNLSQYQVAVNVNAKFLVNI